MYLFYSSLRNSYGTDKMSRRDQARAQENNNFGPYDKIKLRIVRNIVSKLLYQIKKSVSD